MLMLADKTTVKKVNLWVWYFFTVTNSTLVHRNEAAFQFTWIYVFNLEAAPEYSHKSQLFRRRQKTGWRVREKQTELQR